MIEDNKDERVILITGASGFIGKYLINRMKEKKQNKIVLLTSKDIEGFICINHQGYNYSVNDFYKKGVHRIDVLIHLGWFVPESGNTDVKGGLAEAVYNTGYLLKNLPNIPKKVVYCSSVSVYGRFKDEEYKHSNSVLNELSAVITDDEYSFSKYVGELIVKGWASEYNVAVDILRLAPIYGAGDKRENEFIGKIINQALNGEKIYLYANPKMKRNLLYVKDACKFIEQAGDLEEEIGVINVVSDENLTMEEIVKVVIDKAKNMSDYEVVLREYRGHDLAFDATKRRKHLGKEIYTFEEGVMETLDIIKGKELMR